MNRKNHKEINNKEYLQQIDEALDLRSKGKNYESIATLSKIFEYIPSEDIVALGIVGSLFREANDLSKSLYCFQKAVNSDPKSPRASLGLFHSLWRLERYNEGFDELERFLSISESEAHSMLLEEMRQEFFNDAKDKYDDYFKLINEMRKSLLTKE